jgi:hypothetical protein
VLKVVVPKAEEARPKRITVKPGSGARRVEGTSTESTS